MGSLCNVFERLIGLLSLSELFGTKRTHWGVKKQPFKTYFEANLAVMSRMQSRFIGDSCDHDLHVSLLTTIFQCCTFKHAYICRVILLRGGIE